MGHRLYHQMEIRLPVLDFLVLILENQISASVVHSQGPAVNHKPLILVSLLLAALAINVETMIVNVALPTLVREMHTSDSQLQWIVDAYNLLFASALLAA